MEFFDAPPGSMAGNKPKDIEARLDLILNNKPKVRTDPTAMRSEVYRCDVCGEGKSRALVFAKKVVFVTLGKPKVIRSRVRAWVCIDCMQKDPDFSAPTR